jgi:hypothetical protein
MKLAFLKDIETYLDIKSIYIQIRDDWLVATSERKSSGRMIDHYSKKLLKICKRPQKEWNRI